jgi:hypothetical protein
MTYFEAAEAGLLVTLLRAVADAHESLIAENDLIGVLEHSVSACHRAGKMEDQLYPVALRMLVKLHELSDQELQLLRSRRFCFEKVDETYFKIGPA